MLASLALLACLCGDPSEAFPGITASDALYVLRTSVELEACELCACDVNGDFNITASDSLFLLRYVVGLEPELFCPLPPTTTLSLPTTTTIAENTTTTLPVVTTTTIVESTTTTTKSKCSDTTTTITLDDGGPTLVCGCGYRIKKHKGCLPDPCNPCCWHCTGNGWILKVCPASPDTEPLLCDGVPIPGFN